MKTKNASEGSKPKQQNVGQGTTYEDDNKTFNENISRDQKSGQNANLTSKGTGMSSEAGSSQSESSWQGTGGSGSGKDSENSGRNTDNKIHLDEEQPEK